VKTTSTKIFICKTATKFSSQFLTFSYFITLSPGEATFEVSKKFFMEVEQRMRAGDPLIVELVLK
jgi:hypothetical protein